ncbi:hypothetical protein HMF8227_02207 [Saliniradius amylolyticus]|uniref:DUF2878 domain-containing protein n=1 Tax=Saliniradius amylolyticus TaxID=2183582 RepID=A0A2S2E5Z4_9ALTE|nr:DUF2878 domain-containing protein [Saliniradius amylolyticus]AWL12660.1 hypothetical protein HMF8227_02207 [Saliniradius amylolyticus]
MTSSVFRLPHYAFWGNLVWFQVAWLVAVLGQTPWLPGLLTLLVLHFVLLRQPLRELVCVGAAALLGIAVDIALTLCGVFVFEQALLPIPLWLIGLWVVFTATLPHSLNYFYRRPLIAAGCAAISAPLSYITGWRFQAVEFPYGLTVTFFILAVVWAALMPALIAVMRYMAQRSDYELATN